MNIRLATNEDVDQLVRMRWDFTKDESIYIHDKCIYIART